MFKESKISRNFCWSSIKCCTLNGTTFDTNHDITLRQGFCMLRAPVQACLWLGPEIHELNFTFAHTGCQGKASIRILCKRCSSDSGAQNFFNLLNARVNPVGGNASSIIASAFMQKCNFQVGSALQPSLQSGAAKGQEAALYTVDSWYAYKLALYTHVLSFACCNQVLNYFCFFFSFPFIQGVKKPPYTNRTRSRKEWLMVCYLPGDLATRGRVHIWICRSSELQCGAL